MPPRLKSASRSLLGWAVLALGAGHALAEPPHAVPAVAVRAQDKEHKLDRTQREELRAQIVDKLRAERMWKLTDGLKLDEATAAKLFPLLSKYDDQDRALGRERGETFHELKDLLKVPNPDAVRVEALVNKLMTVRTRRQALESEKLVAIRKVLSPVQMGKFMMIAPRIDDDFRDRIREAIESARQGLGDTSGERHGDRRSRHGDDVTP